ncbi:hypothetical protein A3Q56_07589 [Intoshia linei]|uniref:Uncharacterized protein n=1 Tax=Intoshia linei TaxID=1819745 RepID=A0A177ARV2_9BILA|nr:hypothetical protein A3Q56_07589 [Intoshia linei]
MTVVEFEFTRKTAELNEKTDPIIFENYGIFLNDNNVVIYKFKFDNFVKIWKLHTDSNTLYTSIHKVRINELVILIDSEVHGDKVNYIIVYFEKLHIIKFTSEQIYRSKLIAFKMDAIFFMTKKYLLYIRGENLIEVKLNDNVVLTRDLFETDYYYIKSKKNMYLLNLSNSKLRFINTSKTFVKSNIFYDEKKSEFLLYKDKKFWKMQFNDSLRINNSLTILKKITVWSGRVVLQLENVLNNMKSYSTNFNFDKPFHGYYDDYNGHVVISQITDKKLISISMHLKNIQPCHHKSIISQTICNQGYTYVYSVENKNNHVSYLTKSQVFPQRNITCQCIEHDFSCANDYIISLDNPICHKPNNTNEKTMVCLNGKNVYVDILGFENVYDVEYYSSYCVANIFNKKYHNVDCRNHYIFFKQDGVKIFKFKDGKIIKHWKLKKEKNDIFKSIKDYESFRIINHVKSDETISFIFFLNFAKELQIISTKDKDVSKLNSIDQNKKWTIIYNLKFIFYTNSTELTRVDNFDTSYIDCYAYNVDYFYVKSNDKLYAYNIITQKQNILSENVTHHASWNTVNVVIINDTKYIITKPKLM